MRFVRVNLSFAVPICLLAGLALKGDSLTGDGSWQRWTESALVQGLHATPGIPYWNNNSGDGSRFNIGWCLDGRGNCRIANPPGDIPYFGAVGAGAPLGMAFESTGYPVTATLEAHVTDSGPLDTFGWYSLSADGSVESMTPLFSGLERPVSKPFKPSSRRYGFYVEQDQGAAGGHYSSKYFFFMDAAKNFVTGFPNPSDNLEHFAIFGVPRGATTTYYIGAVDTRACGSGTTGTCDPLSQFDYNDFVVRLDTSNVPEPPALILFVCGVGVLALFARGRFAWR